MAHLLRLLALFLALSSEFRISSGCIFRQDKARRMHILTDPLYTEDSLTEFLNLCKHLPQPQFRTIDSIDPAVLQDQSTCPHNYIPAQEARRNYTMIEIFFLQEAQTLLKQQVSYVNSIGRAMVIFFFFIAAVAMSSYLVYVGHFDYRTLPFMNHLLNFSLEKDRTSGVIYSQARFIKFALRPKSHWCFQSVDKEDINIINWFKYEKWDHFLKTMGGQEVRKFAFLPQRSLFSKANDDELNLKRSHMLKEGFDFLYSAASKHYNNYKKQRGSGGTQETGEK